MILTQIATQLQFLYRLRDVPSLDRFCIDGATARALLGPRHDGELPDEVLLVSHRGDDLEVALYIAPSVLEQLARANPFARLDEANLSPFCTAVEGVSHLLCILWKFLQGMPVSRLELELQAEVDKFFCCTMLQEGQSRQRMDLHERLFGTYQLTPRQTEESAERYHFASALAETYCRRFIRRMSRSARPSAWWNTLPTFYRLNHWGKLRLLAPHP